MCHRALVALLFAASVAAATFAADAPSAVKVKGFATERVQEKLDRGLMALRTSAGPVYLSWRLLESDPKEIAFDVLRRTTGPWSKINSTPIVKTTDFEDRTAPAGAVSYQVVPVVDGKPGPASAAVEPQPANSEGNYQAIRLQGDYQVQKIAIADLDGDGRLDYVVKQPKDNIDPYEKYWKPSPDTYKLEAYRHDGKFLWRYDLGWAIERGIWYSPYVVYDLDGDGKAEVAVKTGEGDPRDKDGRVQSGPEYLTILDGQTGKPRARVDWPSRNNFEGKGAYNYSSRNQLHVAYLDGRTPCLVVERGTYNFMTAVAYEFHGGKLRELWRWDNRGMGKEWQGQGAHWMHCADIDGDGRDEVLLGSCVLDDDGRPLWTTGLGHPDSFYLGQIDPTRAGLQIYYNIERRSPQNGMCLVDAATGKLLWGHDQPTKHIHSQGLCADIDARYPGSECYGGERDVPEDRWLRTSRGELIGKENLGGLAPRCVYWDADCQRELIEKDRVRKYHGAEYPGTIQGQFVAVADCLGDWREEIITSVPGELRIHVTTIPARDRRTCLMQDRIYRGDVLGASMGYYQIPMTSYDLEAARK